jgi:hypothetical protein
MKFTTRAPTFDVEELFPFLRGRGKPAIRLHPRRKANLPPDSSKFGGSIIWPRDEAFPEHPFIGLKAVPLLQLRKEDVPEMPFFPGSNLMQMLWFPTHGDPPLVFWRNLETLRDAIVLKPIYIPDEEGFGIAYHVNECAIHPETVIEYPGIMDIDELRDVEIQAFRDWETTTSVAGEFTYSAQLSICPGSKVGGYPQWGWTDPDIPENAQGQPLEFLMKISDNEWDGGSSDERWQPLEDVTPSGYDFEEQLSDGTHYTRRKYTLEEEQELENLREARDAIGTMLAHPMNIFLDRTVTPWQVVVDPPV